MYGDYCVNKQLTPEMAKDFKVSKTVDELHSGIQDVTSKDFFSFTEKKSKLGSLNAVIHAVGPRWSNFEYSNSTISIVKPLIKQTITHALNTCCLWHQVTGQTNTITVAFPAVCISECV